MFAQSSPGSRAAGAGTRPSRRGAQRPAVSCRRVRSAASCSRSSSCSGLARRAGGLAGHHGSPGWRAGSPSWPPAARSVAAASSGPQGVVGDAVSLAAQLLASAFWLSALAVPARLGDDAAALAISSASRSAAGWVGASLPGSLSRPGPGGRGSAGGARRGGLPGAGDLRGARAVDGDPGRLQRRRAGTRRTRLTRCRGRPRR